MSRLPIASVFFVLLFPPASASADRTVDINGSAAYTSIQADFEARVEAEFNKMIDDAIKDDSKAVQKQG